MSSAAAASAAGGGGGSSAAAAAAAGGGGGASAAAAASASASVSMSVNTNIKTATFNEIAPYKKDWMVWSGLCCCNSYFIFPTTENCTLCAFQGNYLCCHYDCAFPAVPRNPSACAVFPCVYVFPNVAFMTTPRKLLNPEHAPTAEGDAMVDKITPSKRDAFLFCSSCIPFLYQQNHYCGSFDTCVKAEYQCCLCCGSDFACPPGGDVPNTCTCMPCVTCMPRFACCPTLGVLFPERFNAGPINVGFEASSSAAASASAAGGGEEPSHAHLEHAHARELAHKDEMAKKDLEMAQKDAEMAKKEADMLRASQPVPRQCC